MCPIVCPAGVFKHSDNFKFELERLELQDNLAKPLMITKSSPQSFRLIARNYLNKRAKSPFRIGLEPHPVIHRDARGLQRQAVVLVADWLARVPVLEASSVNFNSMIIDVVNRNFCPFSQATRSY